MEKERSGGASPFKRAYAHVRTALVAGEYPPGTQLKVGDIARSLNLSPTPIREALATLSGEAIVRRHRDAGYFVPRPDADEIADLYAFEMQCLRRFATVGRYPGHIRPGIVAGVGAGTVNDVRSLTEWLAVHSGSATLLMTIQRINDRLGAARRAEAIIWPGMQLEAIWTTSERGVVTARRAICVHLRRCIRHAREIATVATAIK